MDENQQTAAQYEVLSIPTMILFKGGEMTKKIVGAMPKRRLEAELEPALASAASDPVMPFVEVHWFEGRSDEQKAEIATRIEQALVEVAGVTPEHCSISFSDSAKTDFLINPGAEK